MNKLKGFIISGCGVILKAVTSVVLKISGETATSGAVSSVVNFIFIVCCVAGIISTINAYKDEDLRKGCIIQGIIIIAGLFLAQILTWAIIIGIFAVVFWIFSGGSISISDGISEEMSSGGRNAETNEERQRRLQEEIHRSTGVPLSDIHVNSDGTKYYIGSGDWNNLSSDGDAYQDNDGNWNHFS